MENNHKTPARIPLYFFDQNATVGIEDGCIFISDSHKWILVVPEAVQDTTYITYEVGSFFFKSEVAEQVVEAAQKLASDLLKK